MVPAAINVEPGDMVQLRLVDDSFQVDQLVPEHNRVTALVAKGGTLGYDKAPGDSVIRTAAQSRDGPM
jgi:hypothetical protein